MKIPICWWLNHHFFPICWWLNHHFFPLKFPFLVSLAFGYPGPGLPDIADDRAAVAVTVVKRRGHLWRNRCHLVLVVDPSEKMMEWKSVGMMTCPYNGKNKMIQTTNQIIWWNMVEYLSITIPIHILENASMMENRWKIVVYQSTRSVYAIDVYRCCIVENNDVEMAWNGKVSFPKGREPGPRAELSSLLTAMGKLSAPHPPLSPR